jgi:hypothetical protein
MAEQEGEKTGARLREGAIERRGRIVNMRRNKG